MFGIFEKKLPEKACVLLSVIAAFYNKVNYPIPSHFFSAKRLLEIKDEEYSYVDIELRNYAYGKSEIGELLSDYQNIRKTLYDDTIVQERDINNLILDAKFKAKEKYVPNRFYEKKYIDSNNDELLKDYKKIKFLSDIDYKELPEYIDNFDDMPFGNVEFEDIPVTSVLTQLIDNSIDFDGIKNVRLSSLGYDFFQSSFALANSVHSIYKDYKKKSDGEKSNFTLYQKKYKEFQLKFNESQELDLEKFNSLKSKYSKGGDHLIKYVHFLMNVSSYPKLVKPKEFKFEYDDQEKILVVEVELPDFEQINIQKEGSRDLIQITKSERSRLIDEVMYFTPIRILYEIFMFIPNKLIQSIALNGKVNSYNKSTGNLENNNIMSLFVKRDQIINLNLKMLDPKECFKSLKGISAAKISEYIPVKPIITFKKDSRVRETRAVLDGLDEFQNLAAIDWQDFENLISELFSRAFSSEGQEVKVTQSSRDKGVDAIVYDNDPIRGGKTVIQAKRYTNVVDVSAVRDLFGTLMNEGAMKGILVTTSNFGKDAYEFANNKPITLLNGNELLGLLDQYGYKFKIDLKEAKKILGLNT